MSEPRVAYLPAGNDGCSFYRMWMPHLRTSNSRYISVQPVPHAALAGCNTVMVQRLVSEKNYSTLAAIKEAGFKIIYDLDDDMWAIQAHNPAAKQMKAISLDIRGFERCSDLADVITVATSHLETSVKTNTKHGTPIRVVNNAVEMSLFRPSLMPERKDRVVIGWGGSASHGEDLKAMADSVLKIVHEVPLAHLHMVGMIPDMRFVGHKKILAHTWVPVKEYPARLSSWNWDIVMAPLTDNRFNRSKSGIKMMEAGAMKLPCLASDVQPYREFVSHASELEFLLCKYPKDWYEKAKELVLNRDLRKKLGEIAYQVTKEIYSMEVREAQWWNIYESVLSQSSLS